MVYKSKKDAKVTAQIIEQTDTKVKLEYLTGDKKGEQFEVSEATLKRWWLKDTTGQSVDEILNLDYDLINTPYPEPTEQKYIPVPASVEEYEIKKHGSSKFRNRDIPTLEELVEIFGQYLSKINDTSGYVKFKDGTTMWRKSACYDLYLTETLWEPLVMKGFKSEPNKEKRRPYHIKMTTKEEIEKLKKVGEKTLKEF